MESAKTEACNMVYKGNGRDVADIDCQRIEPGLIRSFWKPSPEELAVLNAGGHVTLDIHTEPIPPTMVGVVGNKEVAYDD